MPIRRCLAIVGLLAVTGCGGDGSERVEGVPSPFDCDSLSVTVDGEPIEGLDHALGYLRPARDLTSLGFGVRPPGYGVYVFGPAVPCQDVLNVLATSQKPSAEIHVQATVPEGEDRGSVSFFEGGVDFGAGVDGIEVLQRPAAEGDLVALCVAEPVTIEPSRGELAGKTVRVSGLFAGDYCGELVTKHRPEQGAL